MQRKINKVILDDFRDGFHYIVTDVIAGGNHIIECYVGVTEKNNFYSRYSYLELERDERCLVITKEAFEKFGAKRYFDFRHDFKKSNILDGAWLTFARAGQDEYTCDPSYEFLLKDYFYYGSGFMVRPGYDNLSYDKCLEGASTQIKRLIAVLKTKSKLRNKPHDLRREEVLELLKTSPYWGKKYYYYVSNVDPISEKTIDETCRIDLYEFRSDINQKVYQVAGTSLYIYADKTITTIVDKKVAFGSNYNKIIYKALSIDGLNEADIFNVKKALGNKVFDPYWDKVLSNLGRIINRHDRNNLYNVLKLGEKDA